REDEIADEQCDGCGAKMREQGNGQESPPAGGNQPGLNQLLESFNVLLELAGEELTRFGIETLHVGCQRQQCAEEQDGHVNQEDAHRVFLLGRPALFLLATAEDFDLDGTVASCPLRWMSEGGNLRRALRRASARAIWPESVS